MKWLIDEGYAEELDPGFIRVVAAPNTKPRKAEHRKIQRLAIRDLHTFVRAIKTLGAWSVQGVSDRLPDVEVSRGAEGDEILFRLRDEK